MDILFGKSPQFPTETLKRRYFVREITSKPEPTTFELIFCSGKATNPRTKLWRGDALFGKSPQFPNETLRRIYFVREKPSIPERNFEEEILCSGNHLKTRTNYLWMDILFGKSHQFPNETLKRRYFVRKITSKPEPTTFEWTFRSGKALNSRPKLWRGDTLFGKQPQSSNGVQKKISSDRKMKKLFCLLENAFTFAVCKAEMQCAEKYNKQKFNILLGGAVRLRLYPLNLMRLVPP